MDQAKLKEVFSDKEYMESIVKLSAEDAAKSLCEKGVEVTADDLVKLRDFAVAHKDELQNGELSEETLAEVAGGSSDVGTTVAICVSSGLTLAFAIAMCVVSW